MVIDTLIGRPQPRRHPGAPDAPAPSGPPGRATLAGELRGARQSIRLLRAAPFLAFAPRGDGGTVIDLPGWGAGEASLAPLRAYLRWLGYDAGSWGLGSNSGDVERYVDTLARRITAGGERVSLVGWSLGGLVAREVARGLPDLVGQVVTFGTPVVGGPTHTRGAGAYGAQECRRIEALGRRLDRENPIAVPVTAIYTRRDGVVEWRSCIDRASRNVEHVEVRSTHISLGIDPDVWWSTACALARATPLRT